MPGKGVSDLNSLFVKLFELKSILSTLQPGIVCVSGGIDSCLLYYLCFLWDMDFVGLFFSGPHVTSIEKRWTMRFLSLFPQKFYIKTFNPLEFEEVKKNDKNRCYYCKLKLYEKAKVLMREINRGYIIDGTNFSDSFLFRPGMVALKEMGIVSPLKDSNITKEEILYLYKKMDLPYLSLASRSCLLTRFSYNHPIDFSMLKRIERGENFLLESGFKDFRIRTDSCGFYVHVNIKEKQVFEKRYLEIKNVFKKIGIFPFEVLFLKKISGYFDGS